MALTAAQQALEHITRAKRILIASRQHPRPETVSAVVACSTYLKKMGKDVDATIPGFTKNSAPSFLPGTDGIRDGVGAIRASVISLNVKDVPLEELMYDIQDGTLNITLIPKHSEWQPTDVSFKHADDRYDLVIALDAPDLQSLGKIAEQHADFLYRTTIVNIDCAANNEHWGQINHVDLNAVSTTEILYHLFEEWNRHLIDEPIATALLAGMIASTKSFRTSNVTPKTLSVASQLIAMGARREDIVHGLWRTRDVATLKMWGRALSRMEQDRELGLVWTVLSRQDFIETGTNEATLSDVIDELVSYAPEAKIVALIHESNTVRTGTATPEIQATIHATAPFSAIELTRALGGRGTRERVECTLPDPLPLVEGTHHILNAIREVLRAGKKV